MKPSFFIPPAFAMILAGIGIGTQRQSISTLETESASLAKHIAAARASTEAGDPAHPKSALPARLAKENEPIDWKKIAAQLAEIENDGGAGDMRVRIRLQQRLQNLTKDEIVAAMDEIAALELTDDARISLEQMLVAQLVEKDPELALTKFIGRLEDDRGMMGWTLSHAMQEWAKKDLAKASAWFDRQIAAGQFDSKSLDGKSRSRNQFEGTLIQVLLASDPAAAAGRLRAMPEDQRGEILSQYSFEPLKEENQLAFAKLVREQVPGKDQAEALASQALRLDGNDDYTRVTSYLDRIEATPAERAACVQEVAETRIQALSFERKITREDLDSMREWAGTQSPATSNSITGNALQSAYQNEKLSFAEAAELAVHYHDASGNDDVLCSFLDGWPARQNMDQVRILAEKISDEKRREEILKNLK